MLLPVAVVAVVGFRVGWSCGVCRFRSVDEVVVAVDVAVAVAVAAGIVVVVVVEGVVVVVVVLAVVSTSLVPDASDPFMSSPMCARDFWSCCVVVDPDITFSFAMGRANSSRHSPSPSSSSSSSNSGSAPRESASSRRLCMRFSSWRSRAISVCASCLRSRGLSCGSERSSWVRSVRAYSTF